MENKMIDFTTKLVNKGDFIYMTRVCNKGELESDVICPYLSTEQPCSSKCAQFDLRERRANGNMEHIVTLHCTGRVINFRDFTTSYEKETFNAKSM